MKVKVLRDFRDRENDLIIRKVGETLEVTEERAEKLQGFGLVEEIPIIPLMKKDAKLENKKTAE